MGSKDRIIDFNKIESTWDNHEVEITGRMINKLDIHVAIGDPITVDFTINLLAFVQRISEKELDTLKKIISAVDDSRNSRESKKSK